MLRARLGRWLAEHDVSPQIAFHVKLVMYEAGKNAIDHATPCNHLEVTVEVAEEEVVVQVADTNADPWEMPPATPGEVGGLTLIQALARRTDIVHLPGGTELVVAVPREETRY